VRVAITLDDLPFVGETKPADTREAAIARILEAGARAPITGFVACTRMRSRPELEMWSNAGVPLGNHSHAHRSIDELGIDAWREDLSRCQREMEEITGRSPSLYRFPFLQSGRDEGTRDRAYAALAEMHLSNAPVSIDTSEWTLVRPYVDALRAGDRALADRIADAYVEHVRRAARRYVELARAMGRAEIPHVLLLHANALAADHLDRVLRALEADGFVFIPIEEALADPVYAEPDLYAGGIGMSWLHRIANAAPRWAWDAAQQHALAVRFAHEREVESFDLDEEISIRRVADHTWIVTHAVPWPASSLVAEMEDGSIVFVATPYTSEATQALIDWAHARFGDAPLAVINTHFHPDAVGGNRAFARAGARIYGSERTASLVRESVSRMRALVTGALEDRPEIAARFARYDPLPPSELFDEREGLVLRFGSEEVHIVHPGRAHSPDNVIVHFPARSLVYGGCMIAARDHLGNLSDADLEAWPQAIERVRSLRPEILVPGHGDRTDPGLLDHTIELLRAEDAISR
jgi:glyoxylase-like metal-dependent hydrolase (beta-lactamase superfamily II)/peptidoglycan/xylan/chitin deacetylase (PgdA/CDA1 family)